MPRFPQLPRFEDLPPVDLEGWLADQGRNFLQQTDQRISRLGLPDFVQTSNQKIQGLSDTANGLYQDLEQHASGLGDAAQTATQGVVSGLGDYGRDRIDALGQGADALGQRLEDLRNYRPVEPPPGPPRSPAQELGENVGQGLGDIGGQLGSDWQQLTDRMGTQLAERYPRIAALGRGAGTGRLDGMDPDTLGRSFQGAGQGLADLGGAVTGTLEDIGADPTLDRNARGSMQSAAQRMRETGQELDEGGRALRGSLEAVRGAEEGGDLRGAVGETPGLVGNALKQFFTATGAPLNAVGGGVVGGAVGGEHNLAQETGLNDWLKGTGLPEIQPDTLALGGLANPAAAGGFAAQLLTPATAVDDLLGVLAKRGWQVSRPLVERFMRETGPGVLRAVLRTGGALDDLFGDFLERTTRTGERLATEEAGTLRPPGGAAEPWEQTRAAFVEARPGSLRAARGAEPDFDFLARSTAPEGPPGISREPFHLQGQPQEWATNFVSRDAQGRPDGILQIWNSDAGLPETLEVVVRPDARRRGVASALYDAAQQAGIDVERLTGASGYTDEGAALAHARAVRRAVEAGRPVPPEVLADYPDLAGRVRPPGPLRRLLTEEEGMARVPRGRRRGRQAATPGPDRGPVNAAGEPIPELLAQNPDALSSAAPLPPSGTALPGETPGPGMRPSAGVPRAETGTLPGPRAGTIADDWDRQSQMFSGATQQAPGSRLAPSREGPLRTYGSTRSWLRQQLTDENARVADVQKAVYGDRPLSDAENVVDRRRAFGGRQSAVRAYRRELLDPALDNLSTEDKKLLENYVTFYDNWDKANSAARTAAEGVLDQDLGALPGETALRRQARRVSGEQRAVDRAEAALKRAERSGQADQIAQAETALKQAENRLADQQRRTEQVIASGDQGAGMRSSARAVQTRSEAVRLAQDNLDRAHLQGDEDAIAAAEEALGRAQTRERNARRALDKLQGGVDAAAAQRQDAQLQQSLVRGEEVRANRVFSGDTRAYPPLQIESELARRVGGDGARIQGIHDAADAMFEAARHARDRLHEAGIIDDTVHRTLEENFPHYLPTVFVDRLERGADSALTGGSTNFSLRSLRDAGGLPFGRRLSEQGSEAARESPLVTINRLLYASEGLAQRNETGRALERMVQHDATHGSGELAQHFVRLKDPDQAVPAATHTKFVVHGPDEHGVTETRAYAVPKLYESLVRLDPSAARQVMAEFGRWTGAPLARAVQTGLSPAFMLRNALIDAQTALTREGAANLTRPQRAGRALKEFAQAYRDVNPLHSLLTGEDVLRLPEVREAYRRGAGQTSERLSPAAERMRALGITGFGDRRAEYLRQRMLAGGQPDPGKKLLGVLNQAEALKWMDALRALGDTVGDNPVGRRVGAFGEAIETAPRLAAYRRAKAEGLTPLGQSMAMRDVTLDFQRGGTATRALNGMIPFLNAGVQGMARFAGRDLAKGNRLDTLTGMAALALPAAAAEVYNRVLFGQDYADVPQYLKDNSLILMNPLDDPQATTDASGRPAPGQRGYVAIPLRREAAVVKAAVNEAIDAATGDRPADLARFAYDTFGSAMPIDVGAGGYLPPAAKLLAELQSNHDFFRDREIVPDAVKDYPPELQASNQTGATARLLGELTRKSPAQIEYGADAALGGPGRLVRPLVDRAVEAVRPDLAAPDQRSRQGVLGVPVLGGLVGSVYRQSGGQIQRNAELRARDERNQALRAARDELRASPTWDDLSPQEQQKRLRRALDRVNRRYDEEAIRDRRRATRDRLIEQGR